MPHITRKLVGLSGQGLKALEILWQMLWRELLGNKKDGWPGVMGRGPYGDNLVAEAWSFMQRRSVKIERWKEKFVGCVVYVWSESLLLVLTSTWIKTFRIKTAVRGFELLSNMLYNRTVSCRKTVSRAGLAITRIFKRLIGTVTHATATYCI